MKELRKLSESGIYETIQLKEIKSAAAAVRCINGCVHAVVVEIQNVSRCGETFQDGIFHKNMKFVVDLYSPHLRSKLPSEEYEMIAMQRHDDGSWTFTINEFPIMDELAIEEFYIRMVERRRREREEATSRLEAEHLATLEVTTNSSSNSMTRFKFNETQDQYFALIYMLMCRLPLVCRIWIVLAGEAHRNLLEKQVERDER